MSTSPTSNRFISQRLQLHYLDWGNPDAPPLLLLHGGRDHCRNWDWTAQALCSDFHIICPDLRGHGDSAWSPDADYSMNAFVYDLAQLVHQLDKGPINIVAHSLGGSIATRYTALYPENVRRLVSIEGIGPTPNFNNQKLQIPIADQHREWIEQRRAIAGRASKRYDSIREAFQRMIEVNNYLSEEQAYHLTVHGVSRNEDGSYSWKFDNYVRLFPPMDMAYHEAETLWSRITCPTLLLWGEDSWASNPEEDGRAANFRNATVKLYENAGHWLHHDQFDRFIKDVSAFLI